MTTIELTEGQFGLIGLPESGYSLKTLAAIKYKQIDHSWMDRFSHGRLYQQCGHHGRGHIFVPTFSGANENAGRVCRYCGVHMVQESLLLSMSTRWPR